MNAQQEAKLGAIAFELAKTIRELDAAKELIAVLLAELALPADNPLGHLSEIEEDERNMTYAVATHHDRIPDELRQTLTDKAAYKSSIFALARMVLNRISTTR